MSDIWDIVIPEEYRDRGLIRVECKPNYSIKEHFEYLYIETVNNNISNEYYVSIYKPECILNLSDTEISDIEKSVLYDYTSSNWDYLMSRFKEAYSNQYNIDNIRDSGSGKDCSKVIYPDKSPDYRLLSEASSKEFM